MRTIVAVTGEDDRYRDVIEEGVRRALEAHATLILYDIDAGSSLLESPLPTEWSADGTEPATDRLGPDELEAAGRAEVAGQVRAARAQGIDAWGWLPEKDDRETLVEYASAQPEPLVLVPQDEEDLAGGVGIEESVVEG